MVSTPCSSRASAEKRTTSRDSWIVRRKSPDALPCRSAPNPSGTWLRARPLISSSPFCQVMLKSPRAKPGTRTSSVVEVASSSSRYRGKLRCAVAYPSLRIGTACGETFPTGSSGFALGRDGTRNDISRRGQCKRHDNPPAVARRSVILANFAAMCACCVKFLRPTPSTAWLRMTSALSNAAALPGRSRQILYGKPTRRSAYRVLPACARHHPPTVARSTRSVATTRLYTRRPGRPVPPARAQRRLMGDSSLREVVRGEAMCLACATAG